MEASANAETVNLKLKIKGKENFPAVRMSSHFSLTDWLCCIDLLYWYLKETALLLLPYTHTLTLNCLFVNLDHWLKPLWPCVCSFSLPVLSVTEEALLSDCQNLSNPNQAVLLPSTWQHHQSHARLQEGRARHGSGQTLPQPRTRTRLQWRYEAWFFKHGWLYSVF